MTGTDDQRGAAGIGGAFGAERVWDAVGDTAREPRLAWCRHAMAAGRVRRVPGAGAVDHGARLDRLGAAASFDVKDERRCVTAFAIVQAPKVAPRDADDAHAGADTTAQGTGSGQRGEVAIHQFAAGRIGLGIRLRPPLCRQQGTRGGIRIEGPGREHPYMAPGADGVADLSTGFQDQRLDAAGEELRGCGKADGPGADDSHRRPGFSRRVTRCVGRSGRRPRTARGHGVLHV